MDRVISTLWRIKVSKIVALILMGMGLIMMGKAVWPIAKDAWIMAKTDVCFELTLEREMNEDDIWASA